MRQTFPLYGRSGPSIVRCASFITANVTAGFGGPSIKRRIDNFTSGGNSAGEIDPGTGNPPLATRINPD